MAQCVVRKVKELELGSILAPERYDPRRSFASSLAGAHRRMLGDVANLIRQTVTPESAGVIRAIVLDTSDAKEGILVCRKEPVPGYEIGSAKKIVAAGDLIISRLRPYLRQVAFIDRGLPFLSATTTLVCSTEFLVLRSKDQRSLAYLAPFLLSDSVQRALGAAQEGGHHPRFGEQALLGLPMPDSVIEDQGRLSSLVEEGIQHFRDSEQRIAQAVRMVDDQLGR